MERQSEPLLRLLREVLARRKMNTAALATSAGLDRARARKILSGAEPMLVDELIAIGRALELSPGDLVGIEAGGEAPADAAPRVLANGKPGAPEADGPLTIDPWGNHPEQLFRAGFALGCDFLFVARADDLEGSGVPAVVLEQYRGRDLPIRLDAAFHAHNAPRYGEDGISLVLSFDALHTCRFPWTSIRHFLFFPAPPEPPAEQPERAAPPVLRLVK